LAKLLHNNKGYALILSLWVLAILSCLLLTFSMRVSSNLKTASYQLKDTQALYLARGGISRIAAELIPQEQMNDEEVQDQIHGKNLGSWIINPDDWTVEQTEKPEDDVDRYIWCEITAEDAKIPLTKVTKSMLGKVPEITPVQSEFIADFIKMKKKDKTAQIQFVEEIFKVKDVDYKLFWGEEETPGLIDLVTTFSDGKVYINRATAEVLKMIPGVDEQVANEIKTMIEGEKYFERVEDLRSVMGVTPPIYKSLKKWAKVKPSYYRIKSTAYVSGITRDAEGVIKLSQKDLEIVYIRGG